MESHLYLTAVGVRPKAGIVEGKLALGIDRRIRADPRPAVELIDITAVFIDEEAAGLPSAIGEDQDVLRHYRPPAMTKPSRPAILETAPPRSRSIIGMTEYALRFS